MKKAICCIMSLFLLLTLISCGQKQTDPEPEDPIEPIVEPEPEPEPVLNPLTGLPLKNEKNVYYVDIPKEERNPLSENAIIKLNELNYFSEETDAFLVDLHAHFAATLYDYGTKENPLYIVIVNE